MKPPASFWLAAAAMGAASAFAAALIAALWLAGGVAVLHLSRRGLEVLTPARVAQGLSLISIYLGFFAMFVMPFAAALTPAAYAAARRLARDPGVGRILFVFLAMVGGTFGPWLLEQGLIALKEWRGLSSGVRPLQLSELFIPFGLLAAPVGAWVLWPVLVRMEGRMVEERPSGWLRQRSKAVTVER